MHLAYVTNNALRTPDAAAEHLTELGVPAEPSDVITSAQAVARLVADQLPPGARVLAIGGEVSRVALRERGLEPVESADDDPAAVVQGYGGPDMTWGRFAEASYAIRRGLPWFASNTDLTIPGARASRPATGPPSRSCASPPAPSRRSPESLPPMHRETVLRTGASRPIVVGDRLDTEYPGRVQRRRGLAAGAHRGDRRGPAPRRSAAAPADLCGPGSVGAAAPAARGGAGR